MSHPSVCAQVQAPVCHPAGFDPCPEAHYEPQTRAEQPAAGQFLSDLPHQ